MYQQRQGLVVWVQSLKHVRHLRKYGHVQYVSKKMKYVVLYCNVDDANSVSEQIGRLNFVHNIEWSVRRELDLNFEDDSQLERTNEHLHT
ncbi:YlbG family protein [Geomicrobium sediminis]|uniref:UPF0298 protein JOD17_001569 n=1 Tax=Geomicrobium sediminis TaxID=1347788 RepID=A0ABS2PAQ8_9BACL|nr:DUF2129 domain-containing protein [Geomicrobium sediminis]MBM7632475.1 uncharacterized protein YlbG (UPF0298 family) [Geomicrobium sediminis]